ncbi:hypothetical protein CDL15_Pgr000126 [Punica granatum]|uniref:Uncharacterized protein n=1 Tax=Punica granatum TaxID=22663 RepID=A0A218Y1M7_PUNGR|nr:hypothetical protein CDL15_Pgr000126 [Punica granatum]
MDTKSWTRSPKSNKDGHEVLDAKSEKRNGAGRRRGALGIGSWLCWDGVVLVLPLKQLLAGNALVSPMGFLLAKRLLVAGWAVVHLLGTGV